MKDGRNPLLILAAGGTGGHIFPAQALAEEMLGRGWQVTLWTDRRGLRFVGGFPAGANIREVQTATFWQGNAVTRLFAPVKVLYGIASSYLRLHRLRPSAVAGFGGYPAFPPLIAAWLAGMPRLIHEQNGVLGKVNRILSTRVDMVVCGAVSTVLPPGAKSAVSGNPVRADVLVQSCARYEWPKAGDLRILVLGGSQGARTMDHSVPAALAKMPEDIRRRLCVVQQVRRCHTVAVERFYQEIGVSCEISTFFDDVPRRMAEAHIVIARAGASTVAEISVIGRPSILIPFAAAANDHQNANAEGLAKAGAAISIQENGKSAEHISEAIAGMIAEPARAEAMAAAAKDIALPHAAARLADIVERIAEKPK